MEGIQGELHHLVVIAGAYQVPWQDLKGDDAEVHQVDTDLVGTGYWDGQEDSERMVEEPYCLGLDNRNLRVVDWDRDHLE